MNIVVSGSHIQIYGEDVQTYKTLPIGSYDVCFNKMTGFYLTPRQDLETNEIKVYGNHAKRIEKVLNSFELTDRNFGVILSGPKGIGKSLFARMLAEQCIFRNIPIITVGEYNPGIAEFIGSIDQTVAVIFDEFEKTFGENDNSDPQEEMLSLFDGMNNGKKLFVITCNEVQKLNEYLINRPGRFHYHFTIGNPNEDEIREYMLDKLKPEYQDNIDRIIHFSKTVDVTYDYLRAIAFELNQGYTLEETLNELNIMRTDTTRFDITITLDNGDTYVTYSNIIDLYEKRTRNFKAYGGKHGFGLYFDFHPTDIEILNNTLVLNPNKVNYSFDTDDFYDIDSDDDRDSYQNECKERKIISIVFEKCDNNFVRRYCV